MRYPLYCLLALALLGAAPASDQSGSQDHPAGQSGRSDPFVVIVNAGMPISSLTREQVSNLFLKRTPRWPSGEPVVPVDLAEPSTVRQTFTQVVHGRSLEAVRAYWRAQVFKGHQVPPATKPSDRDVIALVGSTRTAVGYVSRSTPLPTQVKPVDLLD